MKREEFMLVQSIVAAARNASSTFEAKGEEQEYGNEDWKKIGEEVLKKVTKWQLENLWTICQIALKDLPDD